MMPQPHSITSLNNTAISLLRHGRYAEATVALRRATGEMKSSLKTAKQGEDTPQQPGKVFASSLSSCLAPIRVSQQAEQADGGNIFEVFQNAFYLPDCGGDELSPVNQGRTSVVILYNLGLVYHLLGLENGCSSKEFSLARNLYNMALSVAESCLADLYSDDVVLLLLLSLFNNMGHIHACRFEAAETRHCMRAIRALLDSRTGYDAMTGAHGELFESFKLSTVVYAAGPLFGLAPVA